MKKIAAILFSLVISLGGFAQGKGKKEKLTVDFYGVDFSAVNIIGTADPLFKFVDAFKGINNLMLMESKKFDVAKYFNLNVSSSNVDNAIKQAEEITDNNFNSRNKEAISLSEIAEAYPETDGNVLVIVAKELNKGQNSGTYIALIFDGKTKEIISQKEFTGKAAGFGLRNFWAGSLYNGMRKK